MSESPAVTSSAAAERHPSESDVVASSAARERHPAELFILFAVEMWERFGFYTAAALMTLYLQYGGFGWTKQQATELWSNYLMFVYATPLIGGIIADRFLGYRRSVLIGGIVFALGYGMLAAGQKSIWLFYVSLGLIFIGNGFFKPNISTMVGNLYPQGSKLKDAAYNIFYMGINVGAFLGPVIAEALRQRIVPDAVYEAARGGLPITPEDQERLRNGFLAGFGAATAGMALGTLILAAFYKRLARADDARKIPAAQRVAVAEDLAPAAPRTALDDVPEGRRIAALFVIFAIVIVFWMVFHQNGSTMTYWADGNTDWKSSAAMPYIIGALSLGTVDSSKASGVISNAINPFWIIVLSLPLVWFWSQLRKVNLEPSTPMKMAIGMLLTALAFLILFVAAKLGGDQTFQIDAATGQRMLDAKGVPIAVQGQVSPWWLISAYAVISLGELMLSPMGLSLVSKVSPARMRGMMMGFWFVATAIGNKLTMIGTLWDYWKHSDFWLLLSGFALVMAVVLLLLLRPLKRAMPGV